MHKRVPLVFTLVSLALLAGCSERPPITTYTVNKPSPLRPLVNPHDAGLPMTRPGETGPSEAPPTGEPTDRTLAAIVPTTPQGWFFKLTGPTGPVAAQEAAFKEFLASVKFADGKPQWTVPAGWEEKPASGLRFATLVIPTEGSPPLELTVMQLPNSGDDPVGYVLNNVNRWRGQMRLAPITAEQLGSETSTEDVGGTSSTVVNIAGHAAPNSMGPMSGPFSSGAPNGN